MNIIEENKETVVRFGRILTEKEIALLEICCAFFQSDEPSNGSIAKETASGETPLLSNNGQ